MIRPRLLLACLTVVATATPALSQSDPAVAAREVTQEELAFLEEHFSEAANRELDSMMGRVGEISPMLHAVFPQSLHAEIDATVAAYFESQRPRLHQLLMRMIAESMTLDEMRGVGLNTARSLEIRQSILSGLRPHGRQLGIDAIRHVCSVVQDRAPQECRTILARADGLQAALTD